MAITFTAISAIANSDTTDQSTYTTPSYTPTSSGLVLVFGFTHSVASGTIGDATAVTGSCVTGMTKIATQPHNTSTTPLCKTELWVGTTTASAGTIAIAIPNVPTGCAWSAVEAAGVDTSQGTLGVRQSVVNKVDTPDTAWNVSLAAFGNALNRGVGIGGNNTLGDWNTNNWTRGNATNYASPSTINGSCFGAANSGNASMTWTIAGNWAGIAAELVASIPGRGQDPIVSSAAVRRAATW